MGILTELYYLPNIEYFAAIEGEEKLVIDDCEKFRKQTFRNRTSVLLANKTESLSVPVYEGNKQKPYRDIRIDYNQKWLNIHLRGIQSAYGKAPFFEFYFPYFEQVFRQNVPFLMDLNLKLLTVCLKLLKAESQIQLLSEVGENHDFRDLRGVISAKEDYKSRELYKPAPYNQLFGLDFVPNLSVIDLLFCLGPESPAIIRASKKND